MAKFRYRMQNILDIKEKWKIRQRQPMVWRMQNLRQNSRNFRDILIRRAGYESKARELVSGSINVLEIRECRKAIDVLKANSAAR